MLVHRLVGFTYSVFKHYNFKVRNLGKITPRSRKIVHVDWYSNSIFIRKKERCVCVCTQS